MLGTRRDRLEIASFGDPGPYCTGTTGLPADDSASGLDASAEQSNGGENNKFTPPSDPGAAKNPSVQPAEEPEEDEEAKLLAKLNELKVAEEAITKKRRVELLKTAIAQAEQRLANLVDAPVVKPPASGSNTLSPTMLDGTLADTRGTENTRSKPIPQTPLDGLIAGPQTKQNGGLPDIAADSATNLHDPMNPDGPLTGPLAAQKSAMFLKPAQLAKGEKVLRIVDFIDKSVSNTEDRTISDLGTTKLVISSGPKKPKLESVSIAQ